ncbi:SDR family NAD(P)-dependent oxidoreductase [Nocardia sp. NPDC020380]|uniref:SDR family NAD(P)-dependent oxidoreductase n=1 Tax=Nocardia sp. NPDC020380 TaxID=3364309 RepID=UPI0037B1B123
MSLTAPRFSADRFGPWAVVTGASSGIGREFARQLAANGLHVVLAARRTDMLATLAEELHRDYEIQCRVVALDLTDPAAPDRLAEATSDLDVGLLVSNAGDLAPGRFLDRDSRAAVESLHLNAFSHLVLTHRFGERMARRGKGGVVLLGSPGAEHGMPWLAAHTAAKAYVNTLGRGLHDELAARGITLTVLAPGAVATELQRRRALPETGAMPVSDCVAQALRGLASGRAEVIPGLMPRVMRRLPARLTRRLLGQVMRKAADRAAADGRA